MNIEHVVYLYHFPLIRSAVVKTAYTLDMHGEVYTRAISSGETLVKIVFALFPLMGASLVSS